MLRAVAQAGPGGAPPRLNAASSRLLATLTSTAAAIGALTMMAPTVSSKTNIMSTSQRCLDRSACRSLRQDYQRR
jgi:hypothetical protein